MSDDKIKIKRKIQQGKLGCLFICSHTSLFCPSHTNTDSERDQQYSACDPYECCSSCLEMCPSQTAMLGFSMSTVTTTVTADLDMKETAAERFMRLRDMDNTT